MECSDALRVQAYFDGEADPATVPEIERHIESCAACTALREEMAALRSAIREQVSYHRADAALRGRLIQALDRESEGASGWRGLISRGSFRAGQFWSGAASGAVLTACAAAFAFFLILTPQSNPLVGEVMDAHLRSLMSDHLIDVASSDHHTVKPWFAGHADVSPPVADFPREGYRLTGGRADYLDGQRAAVVVYRHGAHIINVFAWAYHGETLPRITTRNGYHIVFWRSGNLIFCAVSDTALDELLGLTRLLEAMSVPDSRE
ncbi:MAG TPA: zf-HC2 domain-containing protein [Rhizomicrobium sp.]|jgi:anti-sigma factor RsiW|nr:zf-HC2 domain-containing protein [Rhizomicrobium sp.]